MDFATMATDGLLTTMPQGEDDRWEVKSVSLLDPSKKNDLKKELGKQVSAFANSGGGNLILGISNGGKLEPCPENVGRQVMKDYLSTMVEQSVEYPIRHFRVHRIPFTGDPSKSVFVVAIEDSPAAPHQSKEDRTYYYRIDGHSKPAPHFHVELLRNRVTKAVLKIIDVDYVLQTPSVLGESWGVSIALNVTVENVSFQSATPWGVLVKHMAGHREWTATRVGVNLAKGACLHGEFGPLLPNEARLLTILLGGNSGGRGLTGLLDMWGHLKLELRAVSQNHVGESWIFGEHGEIEARITREKFKSKLAEFNVK